MVALAERLRKAASTLGCSPAEALGLAILSGAALATLALLWVLAGRPATDQPPLTLDLVDDEVVVHVSGAVRAPGIYRLSSTARVADALDAAGGPLPGVPLDGMNLARPLADGEEIAVRRPAAPQDGTQDGPPEDTTHGHDAWLPDGRLDLNRATVDDLETLPGVGPVTAQRIIEHRERVGRFSAVTDLRAVPGIGEKRLQALADLVAV